MTGAEDRQREPVITRTPVNAVNTRKRRNGSRYAAARAYSWFIVVFLIIAVCIAVFTVLLTGGRVEDGGMQPLILDGDIILFARCAKYFDSPDRGDVYAYEDADGANRIGRVIGLSGETVEIVDGETFIDGLYLADDRCTGDNSLTMDAVIVPEGAYLILPDARDMARLSETAIPADRLTGLAWLRVWPVISFFDE